MLHYKWNKFIGRWIMTRNAIQLQKFFSNRKKEEKTASCIKWPNLNKSCWAFIIIIYLRLNRLHRFNSTQNWNCVYLLFELILLLCAKIHLLIAHAMATDLWQHFEITELLFLLQFSPLHLNVANFQRSSTQMETLTRFAWNWLRKIRPPRILVNLFLALLKSSLPSSWSSSLFNVHWNECKTHTRIHNLHTTMVEELENRKHFDGPKIFWMHNDIFKCNVFIYNIGTRSKAFLNICKQYVERIHFESNADNTFSFYRYTVTQFSAIGLCMAPSFDHFTCKNGY